MVLSWSHKIYTETSNTNLDSSGSYERIDIDVENEKKRGLAKFPIEFPPPPPPDEPLGDRASPEGVSFIFNIVGQ